MTIPHWGSRVRWSLTGLLIVFSFALLGCGDDGSSDDDGASPPDTAEVDTDTDRSNSEEAEGSDEGAEPASDLSGELVVSAPGDDNTIVEGAARFLEDHPDVTITVDPLGGDGTPFVCDGSFDVAFSNSPPSNPGCDLQTEQVAGITAYFVEETELHRAFFDVLAE